MNVTPIQIEGVSIALSLEEARAVLVDATGFQDILRSALGEEVRRNAKPHAWTNGKTAKAAQSNGANPTKRGAPRQAKTAPYLCVAHQKSFNTKGWYDKHMELVHGVAAPRADTASPE